VLSLSGCGSQTQKALEYDLDAMEQMAEIMISSMAQMDEASFENFRTASDYAINKTLYESGLPISADDFVGILNAWEAGNKEGGAYIGHGDWSAEVSNTDVMITTQAQFENMDASIEFVFNENEEMENLTVGAKYTTGEILKKAGMNTVIGMGTVFVVLIFISFLISLFKYIPVIQSKFSRRQGVAEAEIKAEDSAAVAAPADAVITEVIPEADPRVQDAVVVNDGFELVAVISAAIAQAEGVAPEGFVVRSIKRRITNKWNGGK